MNTLDIKVAKRDGRLETRNLDKIHRVLDWAAEGLSPFTVSNVKIMHFCERVLVICKFNFIDKSFSEIKSISKIALLKFINKLSKFKIVIFHTPKTFLTARLKSTLFNDNHSGVPFYA